MNDLRADAASGNAKYVEKHGYSELNGKKTHSNTLDHFSVFLRCILPDEVSVWYYARLCQIRAEG
jgi:hypothetical protein